MSTPAIPKPRQPLPFIPPQRTAPDPVRTVQQIAAAAIAATCTQCMSGPRQPCSAEGAMHLVRLLRAETRGLITDRDYAAVLLGSGTSFAAGIVFLEPQTAMTPRERYDAGYPAAGAEQKRRYAEYDACAVRT